MSSCTCSAEYLEHLGEFVSAGEESTTLPSLQRPGAIHPAAYDPAFLLPFTIQVSSMLGYANTTYCIMKEGSPAKFFQSRSIFPRILNVLCMLSMTDETSA